jgi:DNA-binding response OmpR family regulator
MQKLIYIADDDASIRNLVKAFLEREGYRVGAFENGERLYEAFVKKECDLVILDVMMPGSNGLVICIKLREVSNVPIIMLTAKDTEEDYISGLSLGSDDYFTKPFSPVKLMMRVKSMLRRFDTYAQSEKNNGEVNHGDLTVFPENWTAFCNGNALNLTKTEFNLLVYLLENKEKVISRHELLNTIWGYDSVIESRATDDTVKRLRKKLDNACSRVSIDTVWGVGFKIGTKPEV